MNCIKDVREIPTTITQQETIIYFYMLSKCEQVDEEIHTLVTADSLKRLFALDGEQIEGVLDALFEAGVFAEDDEGNFVLGYLHEKKIVLYTKEGTEEEYYNPIEPLIEKATKFKNATRRPTSRALASDALEKLDEIKKIKSTEFNVHNLFTLFKVCSELALQEEYRPFDKAEAGSLKRLLTNLGSKKVVDMIITYVDNFDKWGSYPNILNMVKNKDSIYGKIIKTEKLKSDDEDFG